MKVIDGKKKEMMNLVVVDDGKEKEMNLMVVEEKEKEVEGCCC